MKHPLKKTALIIGSILSLLSCRSENENNDQEKPTIVANYAENFPTSCATIKRGEAFTFKALFTDNVELGSYNIDIHHNFDKHNHDNEISSCPNEDAEKKTPVSPFIFNHSEEIPAGRNSMEVAYKISVPNNVDLGDYHFMIKLTDKSGWATTKGISIKIID